MRQVRISVQVGESKSFDPEDYRRQAVANAASKVEGCRRAYIGAGTHASVIALI